MLQLPFFLFFFNGTATTDIYTLSLHDALPIFSEPPVGSGVDLNRSWGRPRTRLRRWVSATYGHICSGVTDRKSTRLNSSHSQISYAVFCLKKKTRRFLPWLLWFTSIRGYLGVV